VMLIRLPLVEMTRFAFLIQASIKAITALIKSPAQFKINEEQLQVAEIVVRTL